MNLYHKLKMAAALCACSAVFFLSSQPAFAASSNVDGSPPQISAQSAVVVDQSNMHVYYEKNMHQQMYPASITKIMTGLLVAEKGNSKKTVTIQPDIGKSQGKSVSNIALLPGEQLSQESLMYVMFLASANDAAYALAEETGGTYDNFINMMNTRAAQLGTTDTHFNNPNGLPDKNNYTSAYDMALITRQAVKTPQEMKYFSALRYTLPADNLRSKPCTYGTIVNMLRPDSKYYYKGIQAAKSGWIEMSGYTLVTVAKREGRTLICVQMKGDGWSSVYNDAKALLDYGFSQPAPVTSPAGSSYREVMAGEHSNKQPASALVLPEEKKPDPFYRSFAIACIVILGTIVAAAIIFRAVGRQRRRVSRFRSDIESD